MVASSPPRSRRVSTGTDISTEVFRRGRQSAVVRHASLEGHTPLTFAGGKMLARAKLNNVPWVSYCRDLVQLPVAA